MQSFFEYYKEHVSEEDKLAWLTRECNWRKRNHIRRVAEVRFLREDTECAILFEACRAVKDGCPALLPLFAWLSEFGVNSPISDQDVYYCFRTCRVRETDWWGLYTPPKTCILTGEIAALCDQGDRIPMELKSLPPDELYIGPKAVIDLAPWVQDYWALRNSSRKVIQEEF